MRATIPSGVSRLEYACSGRGGPLGGGGAQGCRADQPERWPDAEPRRRHQPRWLPRHDPELDAFLFERLEERPVAKQEQFLFITFPNMRASKDRGVIVTYFLLVEPKWCNAQTVADLLDGCIRRCSSR